jgi:hypothetical protein
MPLVILKEVIMHLNPRRILLVCLVLATLPALPGCGVTSWQRMMDAHAELAAHPTLRAESQAAIAAAEARERRP